MLMLATVYVVPMPFDALFFGVLLYALCKLPAGERNHWQITGDPLFWLGTALLAYLSLSTLWSVEVSVKGVGQVWLRAAMAATFVLAVVIVIGRRADFGVVLSRAVVAGAVAGAAIALFCYLVEPPGDGRLQGLLRFDNAGRAGRIYCAALPFALTLLFADHRHWRVLGAFAVLILCLATLLTDTRAAWLAAATCLAVYGIAVLRPRLHRLLAGLAGAAALALGIFYLALHNLDLYALILPRGGSLRLDIWSAATADLIASRPWYGWGHLTDYWTTVGDQEIRGTHNMYLTVLWQGGLIGLLLFVGTLLGVGLRLTRYLDDVNARIGLSLLAAGCVAFVFGGDRIIEKIEFVLFVLWLPLGIALSLRLKSTAGIAPMMQRGPRVQSPTGIPPVDTAARKTPSSREMVAPARVVEC